MGALTVALGVSAAAVSMPAVAFADASDSTGSTGSDVPARSGQDAGSGADVSYAISGGALLVDESASGSDDAEADPYTADERDALLAWLEQHNLIAWRYFLHGFYSGMRTGELLGFPWKNYQPPHALIDQEMVRRKLHYYQKTGIRREILVPRVIRDMLADNPTRHQGDLVHLTPTGLMFRDGDWLMKWWRRAHQATKIRRRTCPYPWRATFVSQCM